MKNYTRRLLEFFVACLLMDPSTSFAQSACRNLTGQAKTNCLEAELRRQQQELDRQNAKNRNLDRAISVANGAVGVGREAAQGLGTVYGARRGPSGAVAGGIAAGRAYDAVSAAAAAAGQSMLTPCNRTGNSGTANSTPQRCSK